MNVTVGSKRCYDGTAQGMEEYRRALVRTEPGGRWLGEKTLSGRDHIEVHF